jgi:hypothetical protein
MEHLSDWHDFTPSNRSTYPTVEAPVQVRYRDGIMSEGVSFKSLLQPSLLIANPINGWRYIKDKAID